MGKQSRFFRLFIFILITFFVGWQSGILYVSSNGGTGTYLNSQNTGLNSVLGPSIVTNPKDVQMNIFWEVWGRLANKYVDENKLDAKKMVYGATKGMAAALGDPYTVYMDPEESKQFDQSLNDILEGIGCELTVKDSVLVVVSPLRGSPAEKAGLQSGDLVYKIDGALTSEMTVFEAISKIRGPKGTVVTLMIVREGKNEPLEVKIIRDTVNIESVKYEDKGDGIFYFAIHLFSDNTQQEFDKAIAEMLQKSPKGLILDLRFNGGGYLTTAVDVLSVFIKGKQDVLSIRQRDLKANESLAVSGDPKLPNLPLVVLINEGSASASEIVAGAIQDLKRGVLIGEKSFGKGSVQEVGKFSDGSSLRYTIAKWYTPLGRSITEVGIIPDIAVVNDEKDVAEGKDAQLDAAIEYLKKK